MRVFPLGRLAAAVLSAAAASAASGAVEPQLPAWGAGHRGGGMEAAAGAMDGELEAAVDTLDVPPPSAGELAASSMPGEEIPGKFWPAYFDERPREFLIDPQGLLSPVDNRERLAFLKEHAADSAIDLFVYVFKGDQEMPGAVRAEELVERLFTTGRPAAIVYYYLGAPQRAVLYLSAAASDAVPVAEQFRALENSVMQAVGKTDPARQIEAFLVQMSIRIYWMERMLEKPGAAADLAPAGARQAKAADKKAVMRDKLRAVLAQAQRFTVPALLVAVVLALVLGLNFWLRKRRRFRFPVWEVEARLGGPHAAGVGAVICFASAAVSPASQRDQAGRD